MLRKETELEPSARKTAERIVFDVKKQGDVAIRRWTGRLDGARPVRLLATKKEILRASSRVPNEEIKALNCIAEQLSANVRRDIRLIKKSTLSRGGVRVTREFVPLESAGCYVPGGSIAYPSSLVMTALTAKLAGVKRVVVCSPPLADGAVNPLVAAAAKICDVDELYKIGGAQAIAAMAYGTQSIKPVDKIVGPGGPYVLAAKQIVSVDVAIDMPAGPTELLVIATGRFNERFVARDLIAQAEHSQWSICGVVTDSEQNAKRIIRALSELLAEEPPSSIATRALKRSLFICMAKNLTDAVAFANAFAPEHVQIFGRGNQISKRITKRGLLLEGEYSTSAVSDYSAGSNHVLPTRGLAKSYSGLSVWEFIRHIETVRCTRVGLRSIAWAAIRLARAEGLDNHARAILERFRN